ncbi:MAG: hypothetical protein LBE06_09280 [Azoarcus sp.]|jgi:hypothetical protein|nr:hypothetical protein [Azoarcus sp.]
MMTKAARAAKTPRTTFRQIRILVLLLVLLAVGVYTRWEDARVTSWERAVDAVIYPVAVGDAAATAHFVDNLRAEDFAEIEQWLRDELKRYGVDRQTPVKIWLGPRVREMPPALPEPAESGRPGVFAAVAWSLKLRWWASRHDDFDDAGISPQVRLFVLYHPSAPGLVLPHSVGLNKGKLGVVHVFASKDQARQNAVIITHELLHTFNATDKYDSVTLQPLYPAGYAEPERKPLLPQRAAEIMGGRVPLTPEHSRIPESLAETRLGPWTAVEIGLHKAIRK